jgi:hypothetical protein
MTHSIAYDIFELAKDLKEANVSEKEINAFVKFEKAKDEHLLNNLSTKKDIEDLKVSTKKDIEDLKVSTKKDIEDLKVSTKKDLEISIAIVKRDIIICLGAINTALAGIIIAIMAYLK